MKKSQNIRSLLGISQEDLALLLQISRSQIAMYETGKRSLPLHAKDKLTEMLLFLSNNEIITTNKKNSTYIEKVYLKKLLQKNEYQQMLIEKKTIGLTNKQDALISSKKYLNCLIEKMKISKRELAIFKSFITKKENVSIFNDDMIILELQIKKEVLKYEKKLLIQKLKEE